MDLLDHGDVHRGWKGIVRRLPPVDVIVRVNRRLRADLAAQHLDRAVRDHLVGIHVGLGAGPGLPDHQREVIVQLAVDHLLPRIGDRLAEVFFQGAERDIGQGRGALLNAESADERQWHALAADLEVAEAALRLGAPVTVGRYRDGAHAVGFGSGLGRLCHEGDLCRLDD